MSGNSKIVPKPSLAAQRASEADLENFVKGAPDVKATAAPAGNAPAGNAPAGNAPAGAAPVGEDPVPAIARRGRKTPMYLTLPQPVVDDIDRACAKLGGMSRPNFIAMLVSQYKAGQLG
jgi:hypothetical protein